jgi:hypothetical protein
MYLGSEGKKKVLKGSLLVILKRMAMWVPEPAYK